MRRWNVRVNYRRMQKTGRKSAGSAKRSYLLIAHILPAVRGVQPLFNRLADWEQTDKTMCRDDSTHTLMNCLVLCVRSSDTWHEGSWPPVGVRKDKGSEGKITSHTAFKISNHVCVDMSGGVLEWPTCIYEDEWCFSRVCLPNFAGPGFGVWMKERVCGR